MSDLEAALRAASARIAGAGESTEDVMHAFLTVQAQDVSRLTPSEWYGRYAYIVSNDSYFDLVTRRFVQRRTFDAMYRHFKTNSIHDGKPCRPSITFDESRYAMNGLMAANITYAPGMGPLCARQGSADCNLWLDARQAGIPGDVTPWLDHFARIFPDEAMRTHVLSVMAHKMQRPHIKINSGILLAGTPGCGKDSLFAPWLWAVGGSELRNIAIVRNDEVMSEFNYSSESEILVINELRMTTTRESRCLENFLKPVLAAPPELLAINKKQEHPYYALNRTLVVAFSNERRAIVLPPDDRRWFVHWTDAPRMSEADANALWNWYDGTGREHVAHYLMHLDIQHFNPNLAPMMTPAKVYLLRSADHDVRGILVRLAEQREGPFQAGIVAGPWSQVCKAVEVYLVSQNIRCTVTQSLLQESLAAAAWVDRGRVAATLLPRRHVIVHPEVGAGFDSDTALRREAERVMPQGLHLVG